MDSRLKKYLIRGALIGAAAAAAIASAATFNLFQPANGLLVGNPSTYVTTAAVSSDVIGLWGATCNNTTYLRGDGLCEAPPGSGGGTVSSVGLTMPSGFTVGGSPVTGSSVLSITTTLSGVLKGTGSGFTTAAGADIVGLFSGCTGTDYLGADAACHAAGTVTSVALTAPSVFAVGGTPVTGAGTLAITFATGQTANEVLASPNGTSGAVGLRALVGADIPAINVAGTGNGGITGSLPFASLTITSGNVIGLWTGTCSASTFLRGDGACVSPGGGGTVTSVGLSAPSVFTVGSTPVTGSGTLALTFAGGQTANEFLATPNGTSGAVGLRSIVAGDLPSTISSNTTGSAGAAAAATTSPAQCSSGQYATGVTTVWAANCAQVAYSQLSGTPSIPTGANPSASVGLTANNGTATTWMRSDASPALSQGISPTMTGAWTFAPSSGLPISVTAIGSEGINVSGGNSSTGAAIGFVDGQSGNHAYQIGAGIPSVGHFAIFDSTNMAARLDLNTTGDFTINAPSGGVALTVNGVATQFTATVAGSLTSGQSRGLFVTAGTTSSDVTAAFNNAANTVNYLLIYGDGGNVIGAPTGGDKGIGTLNAQGLYVNGVAVVGGGISQATGSFSLTYSSGCISGTPSASGTYTIIGRIVTLNVTSATTCTGGAGNIVFTGLAAAAIPTSATQAAPCMTEVNSQIPFVAGCYVSSTGTIAIQGGTAAITGVSGFTAGAFSYPLN